MIVVTGGCGMIGSNIVAALNAAGRSDILVVDDLTNGHKFNNVADLAIADYEDRDAFLLRVQRGDLPVPEVVFHEGACSVTTEWDGRLMMSRNFTYSKVLLHYCLERRVPFLYASSAAVYGTGSAFREVPELERPLNIYAYSKKLFDDYVRRTVSGTEHSAVAGLRYFNVYGPRESYKGQMASLAFHLFEELQGVGTATLFGAYGGYGPGGQRRDFVHVADVAAVNLWLWQSGRSGIFNCGSGRAESFNTLAETMIEVLGKGSIRYVEFPDHLKGRYQGFTEADIGRLREAGYGRPFRDLRSGTRDYVAWLQARQSS
ncbi:MAG: ADP-glyceromanno-heptose 6-epimerase [Devosia sp.]|jgi:ADP-L-glycero-D-manno-heptose 6-epimerase|nr:ADP-glyceromanno-heptose 6-epimerase [Devosia sp.]